MKQRSWILSLLALVLIVCAMVQPALAYFTANTQADGSLPLNFERKTTIEEDVEGLSKAVTIKNTGGAHPEYALPVWIRARAYVGQEYQKYLQISGSSNWVPGADGWWYFTKVVAVGASADVLNVALVDIPKEPGVEHQFKDINVGVVYESTTAYYKVNGDFEDYTDADWSAKLDDGTSGPSGT